MKVTGKIIFKATKGRKDPWVKKQVENDYFLAMQIIKIDDKEVKTTEEAFSILSTSFPEIFLNGELVNNFFSNITLPPGAENIPHITLGNFPDFRINRRIENDIDLKIIPNAEEIQDEMLTFDISEKDFELVVATKNEHVKNLIQQKIFKFNPAISDPQIAPTVGINRDAILNLKPSFETQKRLSDYAKSVFGNDYQITNSLKQPIPYHFTVAQTNQLTKKLEQIASTQIAETKEERAININILS